MPSVSELHWAAGFLDGEGWFGRRAIGEVRLEANQNYRHSLDKLQKLFGGRIYQIDQSHKPNLHFEVFTWRLSGKKAAGVMMTLWILLSPYRQQTIEEVLKRWRFAPRKRPGQHNRNKIECKQGHSLSGDNLYITPDNRRACRKCRNEAQYAYRRRKVCLA